MPINFKQCPKCGSKNSVRIEYGMPNNKLYQEEKAGKIKIGGCVINEKNPQYFCKDCEYEWSREEVINAAYSEIKSISASVGGYFGGHYYVAIDLENLKTSWNFTLGGTDKEYIKSIKAITAAKFIEQLKIINILNWKAKYIEPGICDRTQWSITILTNKRTIHKYEDNKFPKEWDLFCNSVEKIVGRKFR